MQKTNVSVYLAGPMMSCSERQKVEWRRQIKKVLKAKGYRVLDPTDASARKGALAVVPDIEQADVVIANLWRESIGTILGVAHARRIGTPVILIDPNYIDTGVLKEMVGRDCVVQTPTEAVAKLEAKVAPDLLRIIHLNKRDGTKVEFDKRKLQRSLRALFNNGKVDDAILLSMVLRRTTRNLYERSRTGVSIPTSVLKEIIFFELKTLAAERKSAEIEALTVMLAETWKKQEGKKDVERMWDDLAVENDRLRAALAAIEFERDNLASQLQRERNPPLTIRADAGKQEQSVFDKLVEVIGSGKVLCIHNVDCSGFRSKFAHAGLSTDEFELLFEERALDGRQSNLNQDLEADLKSYSYVLYAFTGLRHSSSSISGFANLISGSSSDVVTRKFIAEINRQLSAT